MTEFNFTTLIVGVIIVGMFALGITTFMGDLATTYGLPYNDSSLETFKTVQEMDNLSQQINNEVFNDETSSTVDFVESLASQGGATMKMSFKSVELIKSMLQDASSYIGIPAWLVGGILAIIVVILSFLAISVLTKSFQKL